MTSLFFERKFNILRWLLVSEKLKLKSAGELFSAKNCLVMPLDSGKITGVFLVSLTGVDTYPLILGLKVICVMSSLGIRFWGGQLTTTDANWSKEVFNHNDLF